MPLTKESPRKIYESCLGRPVRAYQWNELKQQLATSSLPLTLDNLKFVAKCKKVAPRKAIASEVLQMVVQSALDLKGEIKGAVLKDYIYQREK